MDTKTVYVPVPIAERLPEKEGRYPIVLADKVSERYFNYGEFYGDDQFTHWLEKQEMVVMTKDEFESIADKIWTNAGNYYQDTNRNYPNFEDTLKLIVL